MGEKIWSSGRIIAFGVGRQESVLTPWKALNRGLLILHDRLQVLREWPDVCSLLFRNEVAVGK